MKPFRPMLAGTVTAPEKLRFPMLATPKIDGIRCLVLGGKALTRSLKPVPNRYIQRLASTLPEGLDGELLCGDFNSTQSAVMSEDGEPDFIYLVFDQIGPGGYSYRVDGLLRLSLPGWCFRLMPVAIEDRYALDDYEAKCLAGGYEGVMLRAPGGPYKFGRSTEKEGYLLKLKRFEDSEAVVVGFEEQMRNGNEATTNALGLTERSSHKANLVPAGVLGTLLVRDIYTGVEFGVSTGMTAAQRADLWARRDTLLGQVVKYKHQPHGAKEAPRLPVFLGFRDWRDM